MRYALMASIGLVLALTACGFTKPPSATAPQVIQVCPQPTPEMLAKPVKPPAPTKGYRLKTFSPTPPTTASGASGSTPNSTP